MKLFLSLVALARRALAAYRVRQLEIRLHDLKLILAELQHYESRYYMQRQIETVRQDLVAARGDYNALLPPGQRRTWRIA